MKNTGNRINSIAVWELLINSVDSIIELSDGSILKSNAAADKLLAGIIKDRNNRFNLAAISPKFQSGGELSAEYEKKIFHRALLKGFVRTGWVLEDHSRKEIYVEITILPIDAAEGKDYFLFIRDMNEEVRMRKQFAKLQGKFHQKTGEINMKNKEIVSQRDIIETQRDVAFKQRDEIAYKKQAIVDSIRYASRIQNALLPLDKTFAECFSSHFILFLPKDIIGGDFYWISNKHEKIVVAGADCTGHGVPGALMSIMGMTFLDEIVNQLGILQPDLILKDLRQRIISSLGQTGNSGEPFDGMDIALITLDYQNNKLQYAGAYNNLIVVKNKILTEIKADKMPLAYHTGSNARFTNHEIDISTNDSIYIYSDGFSDQFGWREDKKYKLSRFKELLQNVQDVPVDCQKVLLENEFNNWKGEVDQLDDILVMGMQI